MGSSTCSAEEPAPWSAGRVLIVGPSQGCGAELGTYLEARGLVVKRDLDFGRSARRLAREHIDVAILHDCLDERATLQLCSVFASRAGVILLTGKDASEIGMIALEAGADDYVRAPHNPREVVARVHALLRRRRRRDRPAQRRLTEDLVLDPSGHVAARDGGAVRITPLQGRLLDALCRRRGQVVPRAELLDLVYGDAYDGGDRAIDVQVSRLRRRLAPLGAGELISSYRGLGYGLQA